MSHKKAGSMIRRRITPVLLAILIGASSIPMNVPKLVTYANTSESIEELEIKLNDIDGKIDSISDAMSDAINDTEINKLEKEMMELEKERSTIEEKINNLTENEDGESGPGSTEEVDKEETPVIKPPTQDDKNDVVLDDGDLVVSDDIQNVKSGIRVTEVYSINNSLANCYYKPKVDDVPLLANRILKVGKYSVAYTGFFDLNVSETAKPKGEQSRALEIIGYDCLLMEEKYDTMTNKYSQRLISDEGITQETAIMNMYKALGLEQYDIKMTHEKATYTSGNSPVSTLLNRSTIKYNGSGNSIKAIDNMIAYNTNVFVTRTNPVLYMKRLSQDFNISMSSDKSNKMTNADFLVLAASMMRFYGEPEMSTNEMNQLIQVYGNDIPQGMNEELKDAWIYLKSRGVLNVEKLDLFAFMNKSDMFDILMRIKDKDSRVNYKDIQIVTTLGTEIINQGYYPHNNMEVIQTDTPLIETEIDNTKVESYDCLVPISDYSRFVGVTGSFLKTMFLSDNPRDIGQVVPGSSYVGIVDSMYYHFIVPSEIKDELLIDGKFMRIDTPAKNDKPGAMYLQVGGGVYGFDASTNVNGERCNYFKRRPFATNEYPDYVDDNRKNGTEFDWTTWYGDDEKEDVEEDPIITPDEPDKGFENWNGPSVEIVSDFTWAQETSGKWRCYKNKGEEKQLLQAGFYYLGGSTPIGDAQKHIYAFDNDGYMVTGWVQDAYLWTYMKPDGSLTYSETVLVNDVSYEFDQWGYWIDMNYNIPEDREDIWTMYDNIVGTWQLDNGVWWYMLSDGTWPSDSVNRIDDKFYGFDDEGYMVTGWAQYDGYKYYFNDPDGYMLLNATTPDGYKVGPNGRVDERWQLAIKSSKFYKLAIEPFLPIIAWAAPYDSGGDSGSNIVARNQSRWYTHKIPKAICLSTIEEIKQLLIDKETVTTDNTYIVIHTKRTKGDMLSNIKFVSPMPEEYTLMQEGAAILNIGKDNSMMIPYIDLHNAGLMKGMVKSSDGKTLTLMAGRPESYLNGSDAFRGFGEITLDNANHTILVGTTIYKVDNETTLFCELDEEGVEYTYTTSSGDSKTIDGKMMYIDFRAAFGWSADAISYYQSDDRMYVSIGASATNKSGIKTQDAYINVVNGKKQLNVIGIQGYSRPLFLVHNSYPVANWALVRKTNTQLSGSSNNIVITYADSMFDDASRPTDYEKVKNVVGWAPKLDGYCFRLINLNEVTSSGGSISSLVPEKSLTVEPGKFYYEPTYGVVYCPPTVDEWNTQEGYKKYLSGEWPLPITAKSKTVAMYFEDKSVPVLEGKTYGVYKTSNRITSTMTPQIAGLSYLLYAKNTVTQDLSSLPMKKEDGSAGFNSSTAVYFGQNRLYTSMSGDIVIDGITNSSGTVMSVDKSNFSYKDYMKVNTIYSSAPDNRNLVGNIGGGLAVYVNIPTALTYEISTVQGDNTTQNTFTNSGLTNIFTGYEEFKFSSLLSKIDEGTSFILLIAMQVVPLVLFTLSMIVLLCSLLADWKFIRWLFNKFFDPIEILTFGKRNVDTANGIQYYGCVFLTTMIFALWANGNFLRILAWIFQAFGQYMNIINNM